MNSEYTDTFDDPSDVNALLLVVNTKRNPQKEEPADRNRLISILCDNKAITDIRAAGMFVDFLGATDSTAPEIPALKNCIAEAQACLVQWDKSKEAIGVLLQQLNQRARYRNELAKILDKIEWEKANAQQIQAWGTGVTEDYQARAAANPDRGFDLAVAHAADRVNAIEAHRMICEEVLPGLEKSLAELKSNLIAHELAMGLVH